MLAFFSRRLQFWLLLAIGAPLLAWLLSKIGALLERRTGSTALTRALRKAGGWIGRRSRGPLAPDADHPER